jgi:nitroreductase/CTP:molybdopterin cytidylyltransferase MocA
MAERVCAIVPAAGAGRRLGEDKALLELDGQRAIERVVGSCIEGGAASVVVVRAAGAAPLPDTVRARATIVEVTPGSQMIDSVRAGLRARPADSDGVLVFPVDHALVGPETVARVLVHLRTGGPDIVLPLWRDRPGHPLALARSLETEIFDAARTATLRDVIRRDPDRVRAVAVRDPWIARDLDEPDDLRAARAFLRWSGLPILDQMRAHRSHRSFHADPVPDEQLERLVEAARCASTSSLMQSYTVVAVRDAERKARIAALCGDQRHIHEAPLFLALCADLHKLELCCARHGKQLAADSFEIFLQSTIDVALLGQNLLLAAEAEGLGGCMLGAARNHPLELAAELALPAHVYVVFGMVLGRPADDPIPRGRMPLAGVLHRERYDPVALDAALDAADAGMRAWARRTNSERGGYQGRPVNEQKGWTDRMAALWSTERAPKARRHLLGALRKLGFGLE